jgi:hypothetical protein
MRKTWAAAAIVATFVLVLLAPSASSTSRSTDSLAVAGLTKSFADGGRLMISGNTKVVGDGSARTCTTDALAWAMKSGGDISFNCGPNKVTIYIDKTLITCNTHNCQHPWEGGVPVAHMTLDGGGKVILDARKERGIFYANTCREEFGWLSSTCQLETTPVITFKNITFKNGNATHPPQGYEDLRGGGAIAMRGGKLNVDHVLFYGNKCVIQDSDAGGGAVRAVGMEQWVLIKKSIFTSNYCANGGAVSSLHAPLYIVDSGIKFNSATGTGASSGQGGNGGAVYFDGTSDQVKIVRTKIFANKATEGGPGVFYVSNDRSGRLFIDRSDIYDNTGERFYTAPYRDIFYLGNGPIVVTGSRIE